MNRGIKVLAAAREPEPRPWVDSLPAGGIVPAGVHRRRHGANATRPRSAHPAEGAHWRALLNSSPFHPAGAACGASAEARPLSAVAASRRTPRGGSVPTTAGPCRHSQCLRCAQRANARVDARVPRVRPAQISTTVTVPASPVAAASPRMGPAAACDGHRGRRRRRPASAAASAGAHAAFRRELHREARRASGLVPRPEEPQAPNPAGAVLPLVGAAQPAQASLDHAPPPRLHGPHAPVICLPLAYGLGDPALRLAASRPYPQHQQRMQAGRSGPLVARHAPSLHSPDPAVARREALPNRRQGWAQQQRRGGDGGRGGGDLALAKSVSAVRRRRAASTPRYR